MTRASITDRRLLSASGAAVYLGLSVTTRRGLPIPRRMRNTRRPYDIRDLDARVDALPYEGEASDEVTACDRAFGLCS